MTDEATCGQGSHVEWIRTEGVEPTCTQPGISSKIVCYACRTVISEPEVLSATGHTYGEWTETVPATCTEDGEEKRTCACGAEETRKIDATGHRYSDGICSLCGKVCSCNCHKGGFSDFIWNILCIFYKIFKINRVCDCGVSHY